MELIVSGRTTPGPVTNSLIDESIRSLTGEGDSFAILAQADQVYMQTSGGPENGFVLEYRNGSAEEHYSCSNFELTADEVIWAFQSYLAKDGQWQSQLEWQPQVFDYTPDSTSGGLGFGLIGVAIVVVAAFVIWKVFLST